MQLFTDMTKLYSNENISLIWRHRKLPIVDSNFVYNTKINILEIIFSGKNSFSLYDLYSHSLAQEPLPRGSWNLQFYGPFLGNHYYTSNLSESRS